MHGSVNHTEFSKCVKFQKIFPDANSAHRGMGLQTSPLSQKMRFQGGKYSLPVNI